MPELALTGGKDCRALVTLAIRATRRLVGRYMAPSKNAGGSRTCGRGLRWCRPDELLAGLDPDGLAGFVQEEHSAGRSCGRIHGIDVLSPLSTEAASFSNSNAVWTSSSPEPGIVVELVTS